MHLGARQVQRLGDRRDGLGIDMAEHLLEGMQDRQHRALEMGETGDDRAGAVIVPGGVAGHGSSIGIGVPRSQP